MNPKVSSNGFRVSGLGELPQLLSAEEAATLANPVPFWKLVLAGQWW